MSEGRVFLDELNSNSTSYKVKVKVLQKGKPQKSAKDVLYQTVVLQDDKGKKMRGVLFGDQVSAHQEALVFNGVYEIANAPLKPMLDEYRRGDPAELPYTMGFGKQTLIRPLSTAPEAFLTEYQSVSQVPKTATPYDIFDVIGTLLYVEPAAREVPTKQGRKNTVREIVVTDHGAEHPIVVSAWNDLSESDCDKLVSLVDTLPVVGFTALRVSTYKGFSLTTTMSTLINTKPAGVKVAALIEWGNRSKEFLKDLQTRVARVRDPNAPTSVMSLSALNNKKAKNTLQDERYQLNVTVPAPDLQKVNAYLGCSHCGKRTDYAAGEKFKCETCTKDDVVSEPRITFNCEVSDGTERLEITAFTSDTSDMFQMSAADIFHMKHSGDNTAFGKVCDALKNGPLVIEVSPKIALSRNNILQWALRRIVAAPSRDVATYKLPPVDTQEQSTAQETDQEPAVANTKQPAPVARQLHFGEEEQISNTFTLVDVAVSSDYPSLRKLPATIIPALPENIQLHSTVVEGPPAPTQPDITAATQTTPTSATTAITSKIINMPTTPVLKSPKVEKAAACTPETPLQNTPKRNSAKQCAGSPSKKKKAACSSTAGQ